MPRRARADPTSRLNLELPERVRTRMDALRAMSEADSITEVVRRAVAVYFVLVVGVRERGDRFILRSRDGTEREILLP